jgi:hypothetical protein
LADGIRLEDNAWEDFRVRDDHAPRKLGETMNAHAGQYKWGGDIPQSVPGLQWMVVYGWDGTTWQSGGSAWVTSELSAVSGSTYSYVDTLWFFSNQFQDFVVYLWDPTKQQWSTYQSW